MKNILRYITIAVLTSRGVVYAQPNYNLLITYDNGGSESINDIYEISTGGYIMCGTSSGGEELSLGDIYLLRVDENGRIIWSRTYESGQGEGMSVIETDNGDFVVGGNSQGNFHALRIDPDGEVIWRVDLGSFKCWSVIELKNDNFVLAGESGWSAKMVCIDGQGNQIWNQNYNQARFSCFYAVKEIPAGGVLAAGDGAPPESRRNYAWILKADPENGDVLFSNILEDAPTMRGNGMVSVGDGTYFLYGRTDTEVMLLKISSAGDLLWNRTYGEFFRNGFSFALEGTRIPDLGIACVGYFIGDQEGYRPFILRTSADGELLWRRVIDLEQDERFEPGRNKLDGIIFNSDGELVSVGTFNSIHEGRTNYDGFLIKLEQDTIGPKIIRWSPIDTTISALIESQLEFKVVAQSRYRQEVEYEWTLNDSSDGFEKPNDSTVIVNFPEFGNYAVKCLLSDRDGSISFTWHVNVTDLYISAFTPDTLALTLHRGTSVGFSLDTIRYTDGAEPDILWTKTNLANGQSYDAGSETHATIEFPWSGDYEVEGRVSRGESSDAVTWSVAVRGAIWAFVPEADSLEVLPDSVVHFEVVPSAPEDESLTIQWFVDGEVVREGEVALDRAFSTVDNCRRYLVQCVVADSVEADTVAWVVEVRELGVKDCAEGRPGRPALLDLSPNPFNAMLTIRYATGGLETAVTRLAVYDVAGREVMMLVDAPPTVSPPRLTGEDVTATHGRAAVGKVVVWDASSVPAGVYFVRLQAGREGATKKVVLMR